MTLWALRRSAGVRRSAGRVWESGWRMLIRTAGSSPWTLKRARVPLGDAEVGVRLGLERAQLLDLHLVAPLEDGDELVGVGSPEGGEAVPGRSQRRSP